VAAQELGLGREVAPRAVAKPALRSMSDDWDVLEFFDADEEAPRRYAVFRCDVRQLANCLQRSNANLTHPQNLERAVDPAVAGYGHWHQWQGVSGARVFQIVDKKTGAVLEDAGVLQRWLMVGDTRYFFDHVIRKRLKMEVAWEYFRQCASRDKPKHRKGWKFENISADQLRKMLPHAAWPKGFNPTVSPSTYFDLTDAHARQHNCARPRIAICTGPGPSATWTCRICSTAAGKPRRTT
jgi:hypothetical protein